MDLWGDIITLDQFFITQVGSNTHQRDDLATPEFKMKQIVNDFGIGFNWGTIEDMRYTGGQ
jgi:hypothetical protein